MLFVSPINGDCINCRDGEITENGIRLPITVQAPKGCDIYICGAKAQELSDEANDVNSANYRAEAEIFGYKNTLLAENRTNGEQCRATVFMMTDPVNKYRLSSDDNILFLSNITKNADKYSSIFDDPYLSVYKKAHDLYGAKVHLNLFYELDQTARSCFSEDRAYFNLSMMTDKFREEFRANSHWLKLAFHSKSEFPRRPYQNTDTQTVTSHCAEICREIVRFAGEECISDSTTIHYGALSLEGVRALRAMGFRSLTGYFDLSDDGIPMVSYYFDTDTVSHIHNRDLFVDTDEDMIFAKIDRVLNIGSLDEIKQDIPEIAADPHRGGFISLMIHEQFFYSDYRNYLPDFEERVLFACKYLFERGYKGTHLTELTAEPNLRQNRLFKK